MYNGKYKDKIFDGRWTIIDYDKSFFILKNIYNDMTVKLSNYQIQRVDIGHDTISKIMCRRNKPNHSINRTQIKWRQKKHYWAVEYRLSNANK